MEPITSEERAFFVRLAKLDGWDVAKELGIRYSGDRDPIRHGGLFYSAADWEKHGTAECVEFIDGDDWNLIVRPGTIHKPRDMDDVFRHRGADDEQREDVDVQILAVHSYWGTGCEGRGFPHEMTYSLDTWKKWRIWRSVNGWLKGLAS